MLLGQECQREVETDEQRGSAPATAGGEKPQEQKEGDEQFTPADNFIDDLGVDGMESKEDSGKTGRQQRLAPGPQG